MSRRFTLGWAALFAGWLVGCGVNNPPGAVPVGPSPTAGVVPLRTPAQGSPDSPTTGGSIPAGGVPVGALQSSEATGIWNQQQVEQWVREGLQGAELQLTHEGQGNYRGTAREPSGNVLQVVVKQVPGGAKCTFSGGGRSGEFAFGNSVDQAKVTPAAAASAPATIPETPVAGRIHGRDFVLEKVVLENGVLTLRQGKDHFPDLALDVMMFIRQGEALAGKTVRVAPGQSNGNPLLRLQWSEPGKGLPETENFNGNYTLILEFGQPTGNKIPGKIFAALPDQSKSTLSGRFEVEGAR